MNIFNIQSLIAQGKIVSASDIDALNSYIQIGIYQPGNRKNAASDANAYPSFAIKVSDLLSAADGCVGFKPGSVGPKVSFRKPTGTNAIDVIIPGKLEITRANSGGGIYNIAVESSFNSGLSPEDTRWNTQYIDAANTSWAPLWDIQNRTYDNWRDGAQTPEGNHAPPQYVGMPAVMRYTDPNTLEERYWLVMFTEWGVGAYDEYGFAYDRYEIYPAVTFTKNDYDDAGIDKISEQVHIGRDSNGGQIYNVIDEPQAEVGVSPRKTKWNSIYTDSRPGYSGFSDLSNLESRVYTDFALALDYAVGNNVLNTELIMHDMTTDLYYKVTFQSWTSGGNGGGFEYTRQVIPQSCPIKFADGSVMTTASTGGNAGTTCCYLDSETNKVIGDSANNTVNVGPGGTHDIPNFSGMLLVNDHNDGSVEMWLAGGGNTTVFINSTPYGPGPGSLTINGGINGYTWTNINNQAGPFTFTVIKTRNGA